MGAKKGNGTKKTIVIKTKWGSDANLPTLYANHLMVSHANQNEFFLFFGQLTPPALHGPESFPKELEIVPIAKIVVSPENMKRFAEAMSKNVENYEKSRGQQDK